VLLIDDIQFLAGNGRSQRGILPHLQHPFRRRTSRIVLSSDRPPTEIKNLEPAARLALRMGAFNSRVCSRPTSETRVAEILRKKAQAFEIKLDDRILQFLAQRIRTNVRRLGGGVE